MSGKKSICEGISSLAEMGAGFMEGVTGNEVETVNPCAQGGLCEINQGDAEFTWDDNEEMMYRQWIKDEQEKMKNEAEWSELEKEEEYRRRLQEESADRAGEQINWEDEKERAFREKYMAMRKAGAEVTWDCSSEREAMEKARRRSDMRKNQPVVWDLDKHGDPI